MAGLSDFSKDQARLHDTLVAAINSINGMGNSPEQVRQVLAEISRQTVDKPKPLSVHEGSWTTTKSFEKG